MTFSRSDGDLRRRRSWIQRRGEPAPEAAPPAFLTAAEAQTVADTDPIALRALLLPDYDGVANAFSKLLLRVVRRCKWDGQVQASSALCHVLPRACSFLRSCGCFVHDLRPHRAYQTNEEKICLCKIHDERCWLYIDSFNTYQVTVSCHLSDIGGR